jgi:hypothetical protein
MKSVKSPLRRKFRIGGEYPLRLYRFFDKAEYADDFVEGRFRIGNQERYHSPALGDRMDRTEGFSNYTKGGLQHEGSYTNSIYLLCCSLPSVDLGKMRNKFGRYVVVIHNPVELAIDLDYFLNGDGTKPGVETVGAPVSYSKANTAGFEQHEEQGLVELPLRQKPSGQGYEEECEFRYCLVDQSHAPASEFINVNLGYPLRYCEVLK